MRIIETDDYIGVVPSNAPNKRYTGIEAVTVWKKTGKLSIGLGNSVTAKQLAGFADAIHKAIELSNGLFAE